ncbi:MAG: response regulator transcription factor [Aquiluna sp.]|nr:response regulator transcription factor [Aquiluna sp.]
MAIVLCISPDAQSPLSALDALGHQLVQISFDPQALSDAPRHDIVVLDCRHNLMGAKSVARILHAAGWSKPLLLVASESVLAAISADWELGDFVLESASLGEVDARVRILLNSPGNKPVQTAVTGLIIDMDSFTAKVSGRTLDLTFKEFELLRHLNENPGRVYSREQLLSEVWGYDYFGGTRTVDVHVRRLRAKLGEFESLIGTVRNVGYRLNPDGKSVEES